MKKGIASVVLLCSVCVIAGCSRNTTSLSTQDKSTITGETVVNSAFVEVISQTGDDNVVVITGNVITGDNIIISTGINDNDMIVSTWVFVRRKSDFCKDPSLWWNCDMDDVYFQEKDSEGAMLAFAIGCYSGTLDKIVYRDNVQHGDFRVFNTTPIQFNTVYTITRNKETIWEQRHMDAPDHRPWGCIIPFATFQILSKWAN